MGPRHGAGGLRSGKGRGRGRGTDGALSGGLVPVSGSCGTWPRCPGRPRSACAMVCCRSSDTWAWRPGRWCPDDATGVGHCNADGTVTQTRLFSMFSAHYGCRDQVLQPVRGPREGQRRERGRVRAPQPDGARTLGRGVGRAEPRLAGRVRRHRPPGALPPGRADTRPVRDRSGSHAPVAGHTVRRMRLAERENGPYRHGPDRRQPVSRRSEMAFHAPPGRCQGPGHRDARPRRGIHRDAGTRMGPRAAHRHGAGDAAGDHRAQAPDVGREPDPGRFPRKRARPARPNGWTGARRPGRRHQARVLDQRVRGRRQGRVRDHRCRTPARPRLDRPDRTQDQAGRRGHLYFVNSACAVGGGDVLLDSGVLVL